MSLQKMKHTKKQQSTISHAHLRAHMCCRRSFLPRFLCACFYKSYVFHCTFFHIWFSTFVSHFFDFVSFAFSNRSLLLQYIHVYPAHIAYV